MLKFILSHDFIILIERKNLAFFIFIDSAFMTLKILKIIEHWTIMEVP